MNMKTGLSVAICLLALPILRAEERPPTGLRAPELAAEPQVPTTPKQREQVVAVTRSLEKTPFGLPAEIDREVILSLVDHAPDIFPRLQDNISPTIVSSKVPEWRAIYAQFVFGFVSFQLEQPKQKDDAVAVYSAALESCLEVYRLAVARSGTNRLPLLDAADEQERSGTLRTFVEKLVADLPSQRAR
jgi:hypothetical protein